MLKDQVPVAGNSADRRRPILTISPADRQNKIKELKNPSSSKNIEEAFKAYKSEFIFSEPEVEAILADTVSKLEEEHKKEINKLSKELDKRNKKIVELTKQLEKVE